MAARLSKIKRAVAIPAIKVVEKFQFISFRMDKFFMVDTPPTAAAGQRPKAL
jgi:hypothetical protein